MQCACLNTPKAKCLYPERYFNDKECKIIYGLRHSPNEHKAPLELETIGSELFIYLIFIKRG